jgi:hypothetical protein
MEYPVPAYNAQVNYYAEFWRLYLINEVCFQKLQECNEEVTRLKYKIFRRERLNTQGIPLHKKHNRRKASEIEKSFECTVPGCSKRYGSVVSLTLHLNRKHLYNPSKSPVA